MTVQGAPIHLAAISKRYGNVAAIDAVDLAINPGEFVAVLGPSGSGKTTLLMAIAGFADIDSGDVIIDGRSVSGLPPHARNIGVVFQRYGLFPHLSVFWNVAFPLRQRGIHGEELDRRVKETLALVRLQGFEERMPSELSGGQQQRVAIARAVVFSPRLLLMDEPLGALDKRLREEMQIELRMLQRTLGTTVILVTHDQEEAMSLADRVAVMQGGRLQQVGSPIELYDAPASPFVANFIGETNALSGTVTAVSGRRLRLQIANVPGEIDVGIQAGRSVPTPGDSIVYFVRPEALEIGGPGDVSAEIAAIVSLGNIDLFVVRAGGLELKLKRLRRPGQRGWREGERLSLRLPREDTVIFKAGT